MCKNKGCKKTLENYRGIFLTSILSKLLEKLIQIRIKDKEAKYSSPFQAGSKQKRSTADNIFLIRSIIDHSLYLKKVIHFTLYDIKQCFDFKVVVRAEILPGDFLQTLGKYYLPLTIAKFKVLKNFTVKKIRQFLKALTVKLSIFKNKTTSRPEILIKVYR